MGTVLQERYRLEGLLGSGGMCEVYLASDQRLPQKWAIKKLSASGHKAAAESLKVEAALLSPLSHPGLPRTVDFFTFAGDEYLVMDFCPGQTLSEHLKSGPMPPGQALRLAGQLADVLSYLHAQQPPIIFRDVKPDNIMLAENGQIKLIDFGIARLLRESASKDTQALGTPGYAAPEQYGRGQSDARTDLFALGATLHHALTGRHPSENPFSFPPLCSLRPDLPMCLERFVDKAVALQPDDRFQSASELAVALQDLLRHPDVRELLGPLEAPKAAPSSLSSEGARLFELEQQVEELEQALQESQGQLLEARSQVRKATSAASAAKRSCEARLVAKESELDDLRQRLLSEGAERAELEKSLSAVSSKARTLEVEALRYEEAYSKAQVYWAEQSRGWDRERKETALRFGQAHQEFLRLRAAYDQARAHLDALHNGVPALTLAQQRQSELEVELKAASQQVGRLEKQRQAVLDQLNLVRDEAAERARSAAPAPSADPGPPAENPALSQRLLVLETELEHCCTLWLAAEQRLAEVS
jgi:serine/threonine protein kinase